MALGAVGVVAAAVGLWFYTTYRVTVYWNLGGNSHIWYYIHPTVYGATALAGLAAVMAGAMGVGSPPSRVSRLLPWALAILVILTLWACAATALGRAHAV
jgi:hypothetical protein